MFLHQLRQLNIRKEIGKTEITFRCKVCNVLVRVTLEEQEYNELYSGIPFSAVFHGERLSQLYHFKKGLCVDHVNSH